MLNQVGITCIPYLEHLLGNWSIRGACAAENPSLARRERDSNSQSETPMSRRKMLWKNMWWLCAFLLTEAPRVSTEAMLESRRDRASEKGKVRKLSMGRQELFYCINKKMYIYTYLNKLINTCENI